MRLSLVLVIAGALAAGPALAQLALPGAVAPTPQGASVKIKSPKKAGDGGGGAVGLPVPGIEAAAGRALLLNGAGGRLELVGRGKSVHIAKLKLAGEGISSSAQRCAVDIVGDAPIEAKSLGRPDGLERYEAQISACPFTFDVLDGAVLVPTQVTACVFKAADCQASPGGLWGPDAATAEKSAASIARERAKADAAVVSTLATLQARYKTDPAAAADLAREQSGFAETRAETCHDYARETAHGFCATRLTQARAASLRARLEALGADKGAKPDKPEKPRKPKRRVAPAQPAPAAEPAAQ